MSQEISLKHQRAILALILGKTRAESAKAAGVHIATLFRWLSNPVFVEALKAARSAFLTANFEETCALVRLSNKAIRRNLKPTASENAQLRAAAIVFQAVLKIKDVEISEQIEALDRQLKLNKHHE